MYARFGKRLLDILLGIVALPFVAIILLIMAPFIHFEDKGPVFYNAPRIGKGGREFKMYKLRSMKVDAPDLTMPDGSTYNGADDPRMTRMGTFMRKTSIDELPQILNVIKGDMSLVGPRPDLERETELYEGDEHEKLLVRPGITGYAAVSGRNSLPWHDRLALDVYYVRNISFALDVKIFFKTFAVVFAREGVFVEENEDRQR
ncbi:sugar transferase [Raoultibacter massiliensis]|uniref:sugar transferase n=1 Tax=Raoultibacter massiliensis TaxID=1852371 RepID=UPI003A8C9EB1